MATTDRRCLHAKTTFKVVTCRAFLILHESKYVVNAPYKSKVFHNSISVF